MKRRNALAGLSALMTTSVAGCMSALGDDDDSDHGDPVPNIVEVSVSMGNFQSTGDLERSLVVVENEGGEGEFRLQAESWSDRVPVESAEQVFSMSPGQSFQTGFEILSNANIRHLEFTFESTDTGESDVVTVAQGEDPDMIEQSL